MILTTLFLIMCPAPQTALASTTADTALPADPVVADEDWFRREAGSPGAALFLPGVSQAALLGDGDGDGAFDLPGDVDALCYKPRPGGQAATPFDFLFSTVSAHPLWEDGDLLRFDPAQGVIVELAEADLVAALQPAAGGFDLDAAAWRPPDEFWFSVNADLTGTVLGDVLDGDILVFDRSTGVLRREYTEVEAHAFVVAALGSAGAIGDVMALSFWPPTGELAFTVQSPTAQDATVFGVGGGGRLLPGFSEPDWAFQTSGELDALAFVPAGLPQPPVLLAGTAPVAPHAAVRLEVRHGTPFGEVEGLLALAPGYLEQPGAGVGFVFLDLHDSVFRRLFRHHRTHRGPLNAAGARSFDWAAPKLPAGQLQLDLYFQVFDLAGGGFSPPIALAVR